MHIKWIKFRLFYWDYKALSDIHHGVIIQAGYYLKLWCHFVIRQKVTFIPHIEVCTKWLTFCRQFIKVIVILSAYIVHFNTCNEFMSHVALAWQTQSPHQINWLRPEQNGHSFAGDILICLFFNGNLFTLTKILVKFISQGSTDTSMSWCQTGNEPIMTTHQIW